MVIKHLVIFSDCMTFLLEVGSFDFKKVCALLQLGGIFFFVGFHGSKISPVVQVVYPGSHSNFI